MRAKKRMTLTLEKNEMICIKKKEERPGEDGEERESV